MQSNNIWIKWYKRLIYISVAIILFAGLGMGIDAADSRYGDFGDFLTYFVPAALIAALDLVMGMLIATFFENVQVIRDKLEKM